MAPEVHGMDGDNKVVKNLTPDSKEAAARLYRLTAALKETAK